MQANASARVVTTHLPAPFPCSASTNAEPTVSSCAIPRVDVPGISLPCCPSDSLFASLSCIARCASSSSWPLQERAHLFGAHPAPAPRPAFAAICPHFQVLSQRVPRRLVTLSPETRCDRRGMGWRGNLEAVCQICPHAFLPRRPASRALVPIRTALLGAHVPKRLISMQGIPILANIREPGTVDRHGQSGKHERGTHPSSTFTGQRFTHRIFRNHDC